MYMYMYMYTQLIKLCIILIISLCPRGTPRGTARGRRALGSPRARRAGRPRSNEFCSIILYYII